MITANVTKASPNAPQSTRGNPTALVLLKPDQLLPPERVRAVVRAHPWATLVTHGPEGLLASHMPVVVDEHAPGDLVLLTHTARADPQTRRIEEGREVLVVVQGEHGFLPGAWARAPGQTGTWSFEAVHVHGRPEVLDDPGDALDLLRRTFEHLESARDAPTPWGVSAPTARQIVGGTCCFRLPATRVEAKAKLEQAKPPEVRRNLADGLERPGPYHQPALAALIRQTLD
jgi:transcriptional regulator